MATSPARAWKTPAMIIMMAANRMNPTAHPVASWPPAARYPDGVCSLMTHPLPHARGAVGATLPPTRVTSPHPPRVNPGVGWELVLAGGELHVAERDDAG